MNKTQQKGKASRTILSALSLSAAGLVALVAHEGYSDKAIIPTQGDVPTIGFGTTGGVKMGDTTTPPKALARAMRDVQHFEGALKRCVKVPLTQAEYDAYVSFAYNVGGGKFCGSTLVKKLNRHDYPGACKEILRWRYAAGYDCSTPGNRRCPGLWKRRLESYQKCMEVQQ